jgi:hypothetical protein
MPTGVTDQKQWCLTPRVCVGHVSTPDAFEWELPPPAIAAGLTAGADELVQKARPRLVYLAGDDITSERIIDLEHPPQRHVRKKLEPRPDRDNRLHFEWIALGRTESSFWTAAGSRLAGIRSLRVRRG